ncbi:filamentous hemagglutinin N-terminal domain-containing protein [Nostoc sp.]|uniref:filamentous hemagglutinin N-terminal domain-containing protein n=1 Tax=Nostoc sp. TaxID=1180 RepID=UPI003FA558DD
MYQSRSGWYWKLKLVSVLAFTGAITFSGRCALSQITPDRTLGSENSVVTPKSIDSIPTDQIDGGATRGTNLFHSFEQFSVRTGSAAYFNNAANIENIITRVTGKSISNIDGILKANNQANLFLINPNGIIFGPNASLNINGSFVASTASSLNFANGTKFSATDPRTIPLLTVSVPTGLQFGANGGFIRNESQASPNQATNRLKAPVGLQVQPGKTLALVGGDITLAGGNLTAKGGRIELGSVAGNSLVGLKPKNQGWVLGYEGVQNFQNIQLIQRTANGSRKPSQVDVSGEGSGDIQVQGRRILLNGFSQILANTLGSQSGGNLTLTSSESVELIGPGTPLTAVTFGAGDAGDLTITTGKLIVRNGAQVRNGSQVGNGAKVGNGLQGLGSGGKLTVNASDSVDLIGGFSFGSNFFFSGLFSATSDVGNADDITINTGKLRIQGGARVTTESSGTLSSSDPNKYFPATGKGGNLTVNASKSVEITGISPNGTTPSGLFALTNGPGDAGKVTINTNTLIIRDGATITVSSELPELSQGVIYQGNVSNLGAAGELNVNARSIFLDNKGILTSNSESGKGGNISLQVRDLLLMLRNSQISTNAGGDGDGGNITIKVPNGFLIATLFGNNDITANAFSGSGGKIAITTRNIFGFVPRTRADVERLDPTGEINPKNLRTSDITAFSQQNPSLNGTVQINSPDADPSKGLVELPENLVDASQQIAAGCSSGGKIASSSFISTGRGGLVADPTQPLIADDAVLADWIALQPESKNRVGGIQKKAVLQAQRNTEEKSQKVDSVNEPTQIVEAQGWVTDANGNVVLVAQVPTASPHNSSLTATSCAAH